jgi:hypothetical protein
LTGRSQSTHAFARLAGAEREESTGQRRVGIGSHRDHGEIVCTPQLMVDAEAHQTDEEALAFGDQRHRRQATRRQRGDPFKEARRPCRFGPPEPPEKPEQPEPVPPL